MGLITCSECGREISDKAGNCPGCGCPVEAARNIEPVINMRYDVEPKYKGYWSTGRLTIGIISLVFFALISFQSCAAGLYNTVQETGETSGSRGFFLAIAMLIAGIVGICTRNLEGRTGAIVSSAFYWIGALLTIGSGKIYTDLPIWGVVSFAFGLVFVISAIKTTVDQEEDESENNNSVSDIIITVLSIIIFYPVGLFIMWYSKTFNRIARFAITGFFAFITLIYFLNR